MFQFARQFSKEQPLTLDWLCRQLGWPFLPPSVIADLIHLEGVFDVLDLYLWLRYVIETCSDWVYAPVSVNHLYIIQTLQSSSPLKYLQWKKIYIYYKLCLKLVKVSIFWYSTATNMEICLDWIYAPVNVNPRVFMQVDPGDSDIWQFLLSKFPPSFAPLCFNFTRLASALYIQTLYDSYEIQCCKCINSHSLRKHFQLSLGISVCVYSA